MTRLVLQALANKVCEHFGLDKVIVKFSDRLTRRAGDYWYNDKTIRLKSGRTLPLFIHTLLHELAHHLHYYRFNKRTSGYYKMEMWPAMILDHIDKNGKKWYAPKGKKKPVYFRQKSHGKGFKDCLSDVLAYFYLEKRRERMDKKEKKARPKIYVTVDVLNFTRFNTEQMEKLVKAVARCYTEKYGKIKTFPIEVNYSQRYDATQSYKNKTKDGKGFVYVPHGKLNPVFVAMCVEAVLSRIMKNEHEISAGDFKWAEEYQISNARKETTEQEKVQIPAATALKDKLKEQKKAEKAAEAIPARNLKTEFEQGLELMKKLFLPKDGRLICPLKDGKLVASWAQRERKKGSGKVVSLKFSIEKSDGTKIRCRQWLYGTATVWEILDTIDEIKQGIKGESSE